MERSDPFRIVFMGTPEFAVPSLRALVEGGEEVVLAVTQPDRPRGRGRRVVPTPVKVAAQELNIPVAQPQRASEPAFVEELAALSPDLLVVAAYGQLLKRPLLELPRIMPINVHGSLLPRYRGAAPIQWAILDGCRETGITIMEMDQGMDTGPILLQAPLEIGERESFGSLMGRMAELGARTLTEALGLLRRGELRPRPQPSEGVSYAPMITKEMARLDWSLPARRLFNLVRAMDPVPGAYTMLDGDRIRFFSPRLADSPHGQAPPGTLLAAGEEGLTVATGSGALVLEEIQWPGRRRMAVGEFLRGRPLEPGLRFGP